MPLVDSTDAGNINGKVHNHRFPAANTALPFVNQHPDQLKIVTEFLQNEAVTLDFFANGHTDSKRWNGSHRVAKSTRIDVVVRTRGVGPPFP